MCRSRGCSWNLGDIIQLLRVYCSGYHDYRTFDEITAQKEYQLRINEVLKQYSDGYELSNDGCILIGRGVFNNLLTATAPKIIENRQIIQNKIDHAIEKYRRGRKVVERRDGIRELADIFGLSV